MGHCSIRLLRLAAAVSALTFVGRCAKVDDQFDFAQGLFIHRDYQSAIEEFKRLIADFPETPRAATASFRIAEAYGRLKQPEAAEAAYVEAIKRYPNAAEVALGNHNLGRVRLELGRTEPALAAFEAAAAKGKGEVRQEALVGAGECQVTLSRLQEAVSTYDALLAEFPKGKHRADVLFSSGWALASLGRHAEAAPRYVELIKTFPEYHALGKARLALSDCYTAVGSFGEAAATLDSLSGDASLAADVLLRRAWNLFRAGDKQAAAAAFARFVDEHPKSPLVSSACFNAGVAYFELKEYERAVPMFDRVLGAAEAGEHGVDKGEARYWRGLCLFNLGKYVEALDCLRPLAETSDGLGDEKRGTLTYTYAQALAKTGRVAEAIASYEGILRDGAGGEHTAGVLYCLATAYEREDKLEQAVATLDRLCKELPDSPYRRQALFAMGEYLFRLEQYERAAKVLGDLAAQGEESDRLLYRLAWVEHKQAKFAASAERFLRLAGMSSDLAREALYMAARSKEEAGENEQAIALYERIVQGKESGPFVGKSVYRLGFLYDGEKAAANLKRYAELKPEGANLVELTLRLAENAYEAGDVDAAAGHYARLLGGDLPADKAALVSYGMAWCHLRKDELDAADKLFAAVSTTNAEAAVAADAMLQRGEIAYRRKQHAAAVTYFAEVAGEDSARGARALYMLAWCKRHLGDADGAITHFGDLVRGRPDCSFYGDAVVRVAEGLVARGDCEEARKVLSGAMARLGGTEHEEAGLHLYCEALVALDRWQEVIEISTSLQAKFPNSDRAFLCSFRSGLAYKGLGMLDKAEAAFRETLGKTETIEGAKAQFNIGAIYFGRKQYLEAAKSFLRVEMLYDYPDLSPKALCHAVDAFRRAGEEDRAKLYVQRMIEAYPESEWTRKVQGK